MSVVIQGHLVHYFDLILTAVTAILIISRSNRIRGLRLLYVMAASCFFAYQLIISSLPVATLFSCLYWFVPALGVLLLDRRHNQNFVLTLTNLLIGWSAVQILVQNVASHAISDMFGFNFPRYLGLLVRPVTTVGYATSASYTLIYLLIIRASLKGVKSIFSKPMRADLIAIAIIALMFTRGALLSLLLILLVHLFLVVSTHQKLLTKELVAFLLILPVFFVTTVVSFSRTLFESSFTLTRQYQLRRALDHYLEGGNYLLGTSFGTFLPRFWTSRMDLRYLYSPYPVRATHNAYVVILNECGIVGLFVLALTLVTAYVKIKLEGRSGALFTQAVIVLLIWMAFETSIFLPEYSYVAFLTLYWASKGNSNVRSRSKMNMDRPY